MMEWKKLSEKLKTFHERKMQKGKKIANRKRV